MEEQKSTDYERLRVSVGHIWLNLLQMLTFVAHLICNYKIFVLA